MVIFTEEILNRKRLLGAFKERVGYICNITIKTAKAL